MRTAAGSKAQGWMTKAVLIADKEAKGFSPFRSEWGGREEQEAERVQD